MKLSDYPITELKIGQVVKREDNGFLGVIVQINWEITGYKINRDTIKSTNYRKERYSTVVILFENGSLSSAFKMILDNFEILDNTIMHVGEALNFDEIDWSQYRDVKRKITDFIKDYPDPT
jgi:heat shock protein HspQ